MAEVDPRRLGYRDVDHDPHAETLVEAMDETSRWEATRTLRAWERDRLALRPGERLLDVGCGPGDAALSLAADLGADGAVVGVDLSAEMVAVARTRAGVVGAPARFVVGDAARLDEPDDAFDAVRCERTLQWVADPSAVVSELRRVVRPGGRIAVIDTDWSTLDLDVGEPTIRRQVRSALRDERRRPSNIGRRLTSLLTDAGLVGVTGTSATQTWTDWDPDRDEAPLGCFSMPSLAEDLVERGELAVEEAPDFVDTVVAAARAGRFRMSLTVFAAAGTLPTS